MSEFDEEELNDAEADGLGEALKNEACAIRKKHNLLAVQIIATRQEGIVSEGGGATRRFAYGCGDWFSRYGATKFWIRDNENGSLERKDEPV